jgi:hypothetical protein
MVLDKKNHAKLEMEKRGRQRMKATVSNLQACLYALYAEIDSRKDLRQDANIEWKLEWAEAILSDYGII